MPVYAMRSQRDEKKLCNWSASTTSQIGVCTIIPGTYRSLDQYIRAAASVSLYRVVEDSILNLSINVLVSSVSWLVTLLDCLRDSHDMCDTSKHMQIFHPMCHTISAANAISHDPCNFDPTSSPKFHVSSLRPAIFVLTLTLIVLLTTVILI